MLWEYLIYCFSNNFTYSSTEFFTLSLLLSYVTNYSTRICGCSTYYRVFFAPGY